MAPPDRLVPLRADVLLALALVATSQVEVWTYEVGGGGAVAALTQAGAAISVAWRSRAPLETAAGVVGFAFLGASLAGEPGSLTLAATWILTFYSVGAMSDRRRSLLGLGVAIALSPLMIDDWSINTFLAVTLGSFGVPWLGGALRRRHEEARNIEAQQEEIAREAVARERARLARELHDVVSHEVGMIVVQAGAGDVLLDREPERAREALHAIEGGARNALRELRHLLGLLRDDDEASLAPQPTLAELDALVSRVRAAGLPVEVHVEGEPVALAPALDLSAYRIVQEALTNALKYSGAAHVSVAVRYRYDELELDIRDDGRGPNGNLDGRGLLGVAERVALLGGELEAGPGEERGFRVRARLPFAVARV